MPLVKRESLRYSHAWIAFGTWTPPFTPGSKCCRKGQPERGSCPRFLLERKISSRRGGWRLSTGRQFTKDELAPPTQRLFATCANGEESCWERRSVLPAHISLPRQRATRGIS